LALPFFIALVFTATLGLAGIEPSPFTPDINQCNAAINMLEATDHKLNITLDKAPIDGGNITGALNQLATTEKRLVSVGSFIDSIFADIAAVMGFEPSPFNDPDLIAAFEAVKSAAQQVVDSAARELPVGVPSQFIDALEQLSFTAEELVGDVTAYIGELSPGGVDCSGLTGDACVPPCVWDPAANICYEDPTYDP
jgi:cell wall-associated NlpC family hydrolase